MLGTGQFVNKVKYRYLSKIKTYLQKTRVQECLYQLYVKKSMLNCQSKTKDGF